MLNPATVTVNQPTSRSRNLPTRAEWRLLYATAAIPIHLWALIMFFYSLPAYLMRMSIWNILGILAYVLALALIESLLVTGVVGLVALILPGRFFRDQFVPQGVLVILLVALWMIPVHFAVIGPDQFGGSSLGVLMPLAWLASLVAALAGGSLLLRRRPGIARSLAGLAERFTVLSGLYLLLDLFSLGVVILRLLR